jgi:hypothetical protein
VTRSLIAVAARTIKAQIRRTRCSTAAIAWKKKASSGRRIVQSRVQICRPIRVP